MKTQSPIIYLMGPTASGKTDLAVELVQHFPCDIISVDSAMVYRDMDIGTAKPNAKELQQAPHRLIDICNPNEPYSAGRFRQDALTEIEKIHSKRRIPLLVGGTMMYFNVLKNGVAKLPTADDMIRNELLQEAEQYGWPEMHSQLKIVDPDMAEQLHQNDMQRIQRALEVYRITGQTMTELQAMQKEQQLSYNIINLALIPKDRTLLHKRIEKRFKKMLEAGLIDEVKALRDRFKLNSDLPSMRSVGYRQVWQYLEGKHDLSALLERGIIATRQLAKRQLTWLRSWTNLNEIYCEDEDQNDKVFTLLEKELSYGNNCRYLNTDPVCS